MLESGKDPVEVPQMREEDARPSLLAGQLVLGQLVSPRPGLPRLGLSLQEPPAVEFPRQGVTPPRQGCGRCSPGVPIPAAQPGSRIPSTSPGPARRSLPGPLPVHSGCPCTSSGRPPPRPGTRDGGRSCKTSETPARDSPAPVQRAAPSGPPRAHSPAQSSPRSPRLVPARGARPPPAAPPPPPPATCERDSALPP